MAKRASKNVKKINDWTSKLPEYLTIAIVLILPFAYRNDTYDSVTPIRTILMSVFMILAFGGLWLSSTRTVSIWGIKTFKVGIGLMISYIIWSLISSTQAMNWTEVIMPVGRLSLQVLFFLFLLITVGNRSDEYFEKVSKAVVVVSVLYAFISILKYYGLIEIDNEAVHPSAGFMINRNLQGGFLILLVPFIFHMLFVGERGWRLGAVGALILVSWAIILSQTRSAWLAYILGAVVVSIYTFWRGSGSIKEKGIKVGSIVIIPAMVLLGILNFTKDKNVQDRAQRFQNMVEEATSNEKSAGARLMWWKSTSKMAMDHPLFGVGPGNWKLHTFEYWIGPSGNRQGFSFATRTHNDYLQVLSERGVPGFLLFFGFLFFVGWRGLMNVLNRNSKTIDIVAFAGILMFYSDMVFSFPIDRLLPPILYFLFAAIILTRSVYFFSETPVQMTVMKKVLIACVALAAFNLYLGTQSYKFFNAMAKTIGAFKVANEGDDSVWPFVYDYAYAGRTWAINMAPMATTLLGYEATALQKQKKFDEAHRSVDEALSFFPNSSRLNEMKATIYTDQNNPELASEYYEKAIKFNPDDNVLKLNMAINEYKLGNCERFMEVLATADYSDYPQLETLIRDCESRAEKEKAPQ